MALEKRKKGDISPDVYNKAYAELVTLSRDVPRGGSIELREIAKRSHPTLLSILEEFPMSLVYDSGGQPVLNVVGTSVPDKGKKIPQ
jgi:hypothetical protein